MKRMKIALMAMFAIFMGTTFTSCLDSDDSPATFQEIGNIEEFYGTLSSDYGYSFTIQNFTDMKLTDGSYPKRAIIYYNEVEGEDYKTEKTSYKAYFAGYRQLLYTGAITYTEPESETPIYSLGEAFGSGNYLNIGFTITYDKESTDPVTDIVLYPYEVKSGVLYCKIVQIESVGTSTTTSGLYMSFLMPYKTQLQSQPQFEGLTFSGDDNNIIELVVVAENSTGNEISLEKVKVALR